MRRASHWGEHLRRALAADDEGSAAIEFVFVGLLLLVPTVYLVVALGMVQHQSLGAEAGARHIARAISTAVDAADADARAQTVLATVVDEYGLDADAVDIEIDCRGAASSCPSAGTTVVVTVRTAVALPLAPPVLGLDRLARLPVEAVAVQKVSRFWGATS
jgi:Flp pilus assembly protein TadG